MNLWYPRIRARARYASTRENTAHSHINHSHCAQTGTLRRAAGYRTRSPLRAVNLHRATEILEDGAHAGSIFPAHHAAHTWPLLTLSIEVIKRATEPPLERVRRGRSNALPCVDVAKPAPALTRPPRAPAPHRPSHHEHQRAPAPGARPAQDADGPAVGRQRRAAGKVGAPGAIELLCAGRLSTQLMCGRQAQCSWRHGSTTHIMRRRDMGAYSCGRPCGARLRFIEFDGRVAGGRATTCHPRAPAAAGAGAASRRRCEHFSATYQRHIRRSKRHGVTVSLCVRSASPPRLTRGVQQHDGVAGGHLWPRRHAVGGRHVPPAARVQRGLPQQAAKGARASAFGWLAVGAPYHFASQHAVSPPPASLTRATAAALPLPLRRATRRSASRARCSTPTCTATARSAWTFCRTTGRPSTTSPPC
jgi:hypothetical protein